MSYPDTVPPPASIPTALTGVASECPPEVMALMKRDAPSRPSDDELHLATGLSSLGHHLSQLDVAVRQLRRRSGKGRLPSPLAAFIDAWLPPIDLQHPAHPERIEVLLRESRGRIRIETTSFPGLSRAAWAIVRLPALRRWLESGLRRAHLEKVIAMSPEAWVMDPSPVPPGAVLAGLDWPSWEMFPRVRGTGRAFEIVSPEQRDGLDDGVGPDEWAASVAGALERGHSVLLERHPADAWWLGEWTAADGRIELDRLRCARRDGEKWRLTRLDP